MSNVRSFDSSSLSQMYINAAFDCALIVDVVAVTLLLLTNQAYVLDHSATAATHTMATLLTG